MESFLRQFFLQSKIYICYLRAGWSVWQKTATEILPSACGLEQHFQALGQFCTIRTDLKPANNMFIFFSPVNWLYREQMGLFTQLFSFNGLARRLPNKLSQLQNTQLNLLTVTFFAILKWTEINLRWLIVDGCVKDGKRLTITVHCQERNLGSWEKIRPVGRIVKSWTGHVRMISKSNLRI